MPIIRNPFRKPVETTPQDPAQRNGVERSLSGSSDGENAKTSEFQLSEIDDSGVFIPPSPTETKSFWSSRSTTSTMTSNHRSVFNENEPFSISRESFDSYRRSFDISARSPIPDQTFTPPTRQSLDSRRLPLRPSLSITRQSLDRQPIDRPYLREVEEGFKEVDLNDTSSNTTNTKSPAAQQPKKRSLFARFGGDSANEVQKDGENSRPSSSHHFGMFTGRKRGQSGTGSELRSIGGKENASQAPMTTAMAPEVRVDS